VNTKPKFVVKSPWGSNIRASINSMLTEYKHPVTIIAESHACATNFRTHSMFLVRAPAGSEVELTSFLFERYNTLFDVESKCICVTW
jgi:hypothetical protein